MSFPHNISTYSIKHLAYLFAFAVSIKCIR